MRLNIIVINYKYFYTYNEKNEKKNYTIKVIVKICRKILKTTFLRTLFIEERNN